MAHGVVRRRSITFLPAIFAQFSELSPHFSSRHFLIAFLPLIVTRALTSTDSLIVSREGSDDRGDDEMWMCCGNLNHRRRCCRSPRCLRSYDLPSHKFSSNMKAATLTLLAAGSAAAFAPQHALTSTTSSSSLSMSSNDNKEMSKSLPFAPRPKLLDGSLPGDVGFDPFGFGGADKQSLIQMREAELKHSRLAMLAAVGWPLAELWDKSIAGVLGLEPALTSTGSSPSLLNGGLDKIEPDYWIIVAAIAGLAELSNFETKEKQGKAYIPGDCGFDPLGFMPKDKEGIMAMQTKEIKHGRIAMMAILGYVVQEALYRSPVTDETPFFFKSLL